MPQSEIIVGEAREKTLLEALSNPGGDSVASKLWASDGASLPEIAHLPYLAAILPPGPIVPVCHVEESQVEYVLLVHRDGDWALLWFHDHDGERWIEGGVNEFLAERLQFAWELEPDLRVEELRAWAQRVGHPDAAAKLGDQS